VVRGELHDKLLLCEHCGFERDVLDEVTIKTSEPGREVTIHRRDIAGAVGVGGDAELAGLGVQVRDALGDDMGEFVKAALAGGHAGGKVVTHNSTSVSTSTLSGKDAEAKLAELGINLGALGVKLGAPTPMVTVVGDTKPGPPWRWILVVGAVLALALGVVAALLAVLFYLGYLG
jgi:hypothetical protein